MSSIVNHSGKDMETIDYIEPITVLRTNFADPEHGFILEAQTKIKGEEQFFFLLEDKDEFAFRVCGKSYLDYFANGNELPEFRESVEIFKEYLKEKDISEEYKPIYFVLHTLGSFVASGIQVPVIKGKKDEPSKIDQNDSYSGDLPF